MSEEQAISVSKRAAPGPKGNRFIGSVFDLVGDPVRFFTNMAAEYGDVVRFRLGPMVVHLIRHPDHVRHVLVNNHANYSKATPGFGRMRAVLGNGLLTSDGAFWRRQRRIAQPAFHRSRIAAFADVATTAAERMADRWDALADGGEPFDVRREMTRLTLEVVGRTLFTQDLTGQADAVADSMAFSLRFANQRINALVPWPEWVPTPQNLRLRRARRVLDGAIGGIVAERRKAPEIERPDLLGMLMDARDEETGEGMSDAELRDEIMTIVMAGHETAATNLTWTWYLLGKHPEVRKRLREELASVLGGRSPTIDDLPSLSYTSMVLQESMRLYPPAWMFDRFAAADDAFGDYHVPAQSLVFLSPYVTHRHPDFWPDAATFDPSRFEPERIAKQAKFAYFPFGGGPRFCIGDNVARMEGPLLLATLAQRFDLDLVPDHPVEVDPGFTLRAKHGVLVRARRTDGNARSAQR